MVTVLRRELVAVLSSLVRKRFKKGLKRCRSALETDGTRWLQRRGRLSSLARQTSWSGWQRSGASPPRSLVWRRRRSSLI